MPAYNFSERFAALVAAGFQTPPVGRVKRQTIRRRRKNPTRPGQMIYAYTGMRTKKCRQLGVAVCRKVNPLRISTDGIELRGSLLCVWERDQLVYEDGFDSIAELKRWFAEHYGLPFEGEVIYW